MCTLVVWVGVFEGAPLVVASNRDERYDRLASGPELWRVPSGVVAPRDGAAGGAWWAVSAPGLFVGLTNRANAMVDPGRRSRGALVIDVAAQRSVGSARAFVEGLDGATYNGFHLVVTDGRSAFLAIGDGHSVSSCRHPAGRILVTERSFGAALTSRDAVVGAQMDVVEARWKAVGRVDLEAAGEVLARTSKVPFEGPRVHEPGAGFGTRSSTLMLWGAQRFVLLFADGAPGVAPFQDRSSLLETLFRMSPEA